MKSLNGPVFAVFWLLYEQEMSKSGNLTTHFSQLRTDVFLDWKP